jgi:hypothetical protein
MQHAEPDELLLLVKSYVVPQAIYVLTELEVVEVLARGPASPAALARAVGADEALLTRLLRLGVRAGVVCEPSVGRFAMGPLGPCLLRESPGSMRAWVLAMGEQSYPAAAEMLDTVRSGEAAPSHERVWHGVQRFLTRQAWEAALERYDLARCRHVVVFGEPELPLGDCVTCCTPGEEVPRAGLYLVGELSAGEEGLQQVLHAIRPVMEPEAKVVLVQRLIARSPHGEPARVDDLVRLVAGRGRERTEAEYATLLGGAGFELRCVIPTPSGLHLLEAVAT